jgi:hypothetical protein
MRIGGTHRINLPLTISLFTFFDFLRYFKFPV